MKSFEERNPLGHIVTGYEIVNRGTDGEGRWVDADLHLSVNGLGQFFVNVLTKQHYLNERLEKTLEETDRPEGLLRDPSELERKPPFVLNDEEITDEVLERKFRGRRVEEDLAASLWFTTDQLPDAE